MRTAVTLVLKSQTPRGFGLCHFQMYLVTLKQCLQRKTPVGVHLHFPNREHAPRNSSTHYLYRPEAMQPFVYLLLNGAYPSAQAEAIKVSLSKLSASRDLKHTFCNMSEIHPHFFINIFLSHKKNSVPGYFSTNCQKDEQPTMLMLANSYFIVFFLGPDCI